MAFSNADISAAVKGVQNVNALVNDVCDYDLRISLEKLLIISDAKLDLVFDMAGIYTYITGIKNYQ